MTVTEFATLKLNCEYHDSDGNIISKAFLNNLKTLSILQSKHSHHPLYFFSSTSKSSSSPDGTHGTEVHVYLLSKWDSVDAHHVWIASDENQEMLRTLAQGDIPFLEIVDFIHVNMALDLERIYSVPEPSSGQKKLIVRISAEGGQEVRQAPDSGGERFKSGWGIEKRVFLSFNSYEASEGGETYNELVMTELILPTAE